MASIDADWMASMSPESDENSRSGSTISLMSTTLSPTASPLSPTALPPALRRRCRPRSVDVVAYASSSTVTVFVDPDFGTVTCRVPDRVSVALGWVSAAVTLASSGNRTLPDSVSPRPGNRISKSG